MVAISAEDKTPQREITADIGPGGDTRAFLDALLDTAEGLQCDQSLMMSLAQAHAPGGHFEVACIMRTGEQADDFFIADMPAGITPGKGGFGFEVGLNFALAVEATGGEAVKRLGNNRGQRLVAHQQLAVPLNLFVAVSGRCREAPVTVQGTRPHAVLGLFAVFLSLVLGDRGEQVFNEDGIGILAEGDRGAFQLAAEVL